MQEKGANRKTFVAPSTINRERGILEMGESGAPKKSQAPGNLFKKKYKLQTKSLPQTFTRLSRTEKIPGLCKSVAQ